MFEITEKATAIEIVNSKLIQSGNIIEIIEYEKPFLKGFKMPNSDKKGRRVDYLSDNYSEHRKQVIIRSKKNLRRLINANHGQYGEEFTSKFLTLTFGENVTDINVANYEFEKFIKRLNYLLFGVKKAILAYNVVPEKQKRGAIHYHVIIYNMPYTKQSIIQDTWGNGWVWINKIENVDNVGAYVSEYMGKGDEVHGDWLQGKKSYFSSRGLYKPLEITDKKIVEQVAAALPLDKLSYSSEYESEYLGNVSYKQYNLNLKL